MAGVAFRDILHVFDKVSNIVLCGRRDTFALFSEEALQFQCRCSTLMTSIVILHDRCTTLDVCCCMFGANRIVRAASSGANV